MWHFLLLSFPAASLLANKTTLHTTTSPYIHTYTQKKKKKQGTGSFVPLLSAFNDRSLCSSDLVAQLPLAQANNLQLQLLPEPTLPAFRIQTALCVAAAADRVADARRRERWCVLPSLVLEAYLLPEARGGWVQL